jgi:F-type H+-transporting ATPase subunit epsilon
MRFEIVTGERVVYSDEVDSLVAPGVAGELGILPHHAPLLTTLGPGELRVTKDGQEQAMAVTGGFLEVLANTVTVLADAAERVEEIDEERAREAIRRAEERIASRTTDLDLERALAALRRARIRVEVARKRRRPGDRPAPTPPPQ